MKSVRDVLLGYLASIESPSKAMSVAGFLVTNHRGIPIEFRYTEPVEMSETQRMLYGEQDSSEAVAVTVAASLWKSMQQKPRVLIVEDAAAARLWEHLAARERTVVAHLEPAPDGSRVSPEPRRAVVPLGGADERMARLRVYPESPEALDKTAHLLADISETMRIDEPFERVEAILRGIYKLPESETRRRSSEPVEPERVGRPRRAVSHNESSPVDMRTRAVAEPDGVPCASSPSNDQKWRSEQRPNRAAKRPDDNLKARPDLRWMFRDRGAE